MHMLVCADRQAQCTLLVSPEHYSQRCANVRCEVDGNCVLGHYAASSGNILPTFRDILSVPFQGSSAKTKLVKPTNPRSLQPHNSTLVGWLVACLDHLPFFGLLTLEMGPTGCPETSVRNCHCSLRNDPEERSSLKANAVRMC